MQNYDDIFQANQFLRGEDGNPTPKTSDTFFHVKNLTTLAEQLRQPGAC